MSQQYTPVDWQDPTGSNPGTLINKSRLDQMQSAHHYADGFEEVDTPPTASPGVTYHKVVYCTSDSAFYRWNGSAWSKDIDDVTKAELDAEILRAKAAEEANALAIAQKYTKPADGIPKTDLAASVQTSLGKADTALQAHQSIKTINSESLVGSGNISLQTPLTAGTDYVVPVSGKGLSANDYTDADKSKLAGIEAGAQVNVIESVKVNGTALTPSSKAVDVTVPVQDVTVNGTSVLDGTTAKVVVPTTAADVGALPDTTLYAGSSTAGGKATSAASADAVPWSGITGNPLAVTDVTVTES